MSVTDLQPEYFKLDMDGAVCVLKLNRPPANAHNFAMIRELEGIVTEIRYDSGVKTVVLASANDRFFSAGADIDEIPEKPAEYTALLPQPHKQKLIKTLPPP